MSENAGERLGVYTACQCVAKVCRRSWKRIEGSPAVSNSFFIRLYAELGTIGYSGRSGSGNIHALNTVNFRFCRSCAVLGGSVMVRVPLPVFVLPVV